MAFIQIIEITTTHPEQIQGLMDEWVAKTEGRRWSTEGYHRAQRWLGHGPRLLICCGADQRLGPGAGTRAMR